MTGFGGCSESLCLRLATKTKKIVCGLICRGSGLRKEELPPEALTKGFASAGLERWRWGFLKDIGMPFGEIFSLYYLLGKP